MFMCLIDIFSQYSYQRTKWLQIADSKKRFIAGGQGGLIQFVQKRKNTEQMSQKCVGTSTPNTQIGIPNIS